MIFDPLRMSLIGKGEYGNCVAMARPLDKLRTMFGDRADTAMNAVDRETQFARTGNRVTAGSDTALANRFGDFLDQVATPAKLPSNLSWEGVVGKGLEAGARKLFGVNAEAKGMRFAEDLGRLAVAQGPERDAYMRSLLDMVNQRTRLDPLERKAAQGLRALIVSTATNRMPQQQK